MRKTVLFAAAGVGLMIALASHDAQAFAPTVAMPVAPSDVSTVAGGCGWGWHRGPWGGCRRGGNSDRRREGELGYGAFHVTTFSELEVIDVIL